MTAAATLCAAAPTASSDASPTAWVVEYAEGLRARLQANRRTLAVAPSVSSKLVMSPRAAALAAYRDGLRQRLRALNVAA